MSNDNFSFKKFAIKQNKAAFKVGTDGVLLGASADVSMARNILDIGTGTGLISIMLAQRCEALITAIEPDKESFMQASENIAACNWNDRIRIENTDLQNFNPGDEQFDLIVTNPPYFCGSMKSPDPRKSAARHNDTLTTEELLNRVSRLLKADGRLQLILPYVEGMIFIAEANKYELYCNNILKIRPLPTSEIRRLILTLSRSKLKPSESFLTIEHGKRHEFTREYVDLTRDFYLNF